MTDAPKSRPVAQTAKDAAPATEEVAALQESLARLHAVEPSSQSFSSEAVQLLVKAACAEAAALVICDPRASRLKLMASTGAEPDVFKALVGQSGLWITLRALNERRINIILKADKNPFVPQHLVTAINPDGVGIAVIPFFKGKVPVGAVVLFSTRDVTFSESLLRTLAQSLRVCANALADSFEVRGLHKGPSGVARTPAVSTSATPTPSPPPATAVPDQLPSDVKQLLEQEQTRIAQLESELDSLRGASERLPELQAEVERLNVEAEQAQAAAETARARAAQLEAERAEAENRANAAADMLQALIDAREEQQRRIEETLRISRAHSDAVADIETELRTVSERARRVEEVEKDLRASESARAELESQLAALQEAEANARRQVDDQTGLLESVRAELDSANERIKATEAERNRLQTEQLEVRRNLDAVMAERTALANKLQAMESRLANAAATEAAKSETIDTLKAECARLRAEEAELRETFQTTFASLRSQIEEGERQSSQMSERIAGLAEIEVETKALRSRVAELEDQLATARSASASGETPRDVTDVHAVPVLDAELQEAFSEEATEHIQACERVLSRLEADLANLDLYQALLVCFSRLKGAAKGVGVEAVVWQLRNGESVLDAIARGEEKSSAAKLDFLSRLIESVRGLVQRALGQNPASLRIIADVGQELAKLRETSLPLEKGKAPKSGPPSTGTDQKAGADQDVGMLQVEASRLDSLMDSIWHIDATRDRTRREVQAIAKLHKKLATWRTLISESAGNAPPSTGDDEGLPDAAFYKALAAQSDHIAKQLGGLIEALNEQDTELAGVSCDLQQKLDLLRVVPLESMFRRLRRPVRDAARQEGKRAELITEGGNIQVDRNVIQALYGPMLHVVRNAVAHGIETPETRSAQGKPEKGTLRITARVHEDREDSPEDEVTSGPGVVGSLRLELTVRDDGAGLNVDAILNKASKRGLIAPDATPSDAEIAELIFSPTFSTKAEANALAGRGVGMEVVKQEIVTLGGTVSVHSERGRGMTIVMIVPVRTVIQ